MDKAGTKLQLPILEIIGVPSKCGVTIPRHDPEGVGKVINAFRYLLRKGRGSAEIRKTLGYFRINRSRMNCYHIAKDVYPIGSSEEEAANKVLVTWRLNPSDQSWSRDGVQRFFPFVRY